MLAVSESTPGPIGINMATYVGFTVAGIPGAVIATIGEVTPSIIVILIVAAMLTKFRNSNYVENAFYGLRLGALPALMRMAPTTVSQLGHMAQAMATAMLPGAMTTVARSFAVTPSTTIS